MSNLFRISGKLIIDKVLWVIIASVLGFFLILYLRMGSTLSQADYFYVILVYAGSVALVLGAFVWMIQKIISSRFVLRGSEADQIHQIYEKIITGYDPNPEVKILEGYTRSENYRDLAEKIKEFYDQKENVLSKLSAYDDLFPCLYSDVENIKSRAAQLTESAQKFYQNAYSQSSELTEVSQAMDRLATEINDIASHTGQANQFAINTREVTDMGVTQMKEMTRAIIDISESNKKVLSITNTINGIASQTKLLALNATIEASRAGEEGKAFAVVAQEVRDLAVHSTSAVRETSSLVDTTIQSLDYGNEISIKTVDALNDIEEEVGRVSDIILEITESTKRQAESIQRFNEGLKELSELTQLQKTNAKESTTVSEELTRLAVQLQTKMDSGRDIKNLAISDTDNTSMETAIPQKIQRPFKFAYDFTPPMTYEEKGIAKGLFIDLLNEILNRRMNIEIIYEYYGWDTCQEKIKNGSCDGIVTSVTPERLKFTEASIYTLYSADFTIWTYAGHPRLREIQRIRTTEDIISNDFSVATYPGGSWSKLNLEEKGGKVIYSENSETEFTVLSERRADLVLEDPIVAISMMKMEGVQKDLFIETRIVLRAFPQQLLIGKKSPFLPILSDFDRHLQDLKQDGTMERLMSKYK